MPPGGVAGPFVSVSAGGTVAVGLSKRGKLKFWSRVGGEGQPPAGTVPGVFKAVSAGWSHTLALRFDGNIAAPFSELGEYHDLRYLGSILPPDDANLVAQARALVLWHGAQKFCGLCGSHSRTESGGNSRICENESCAKRVFPRVDPAIIVIVENGDQCLLGRQQGWPEGRYSTVAGFVEPGESLEDAVRREVMEETNIRVSGVRYHSSQPWPFPASLMLGFRAYASSSDIQLNDGELEDARWFTRKELRSGFPKLPYRVSIARRLVDHWLDEDES